MVEKGIAQGDYVLSIDEAQKYVWYHTIELTPKFTTKGIYDWRPYWDKFSFGDLRGKNILDVGAGDGFFSFEFEKRGAKVTALDIPSQRDRDNVKIGVQGNYSKEALHRGRRSVEFKAKFDIAKKSLNSKVERIEMDLYEMTKESIGLFDIVFCGDVLLHLTDPLRALARIRNVCKEVSIISTPIYSTLSVHHPLQKLAILSLRNISLSYFMGATGHGAFWIPTRRCLGDMIIGAGFKRERWISNFTPSKEHVMRGGRLEHGVIHGLVD